LFSTKPAKTAHSSFADAFPSVSGETHNNGGEQNEIKMKLKLLVQTQEVVNHQATADRPASVSHILTCIDMSQPPECRMTEAISYRLKENEFAKYWNTSMDKVIEIVCRRITHSKAGKAMLIGEIVETATAK
jgi:hypothetical protein